MEIEQIHRSNGRNDNRQRSGKPFQNVIGKFDDHCDDESAAGLQHDQIPDEPVVSEEEAVSRQLGMIVDEAGQETERQTQQTQLNVPHPHRDVRSLQHLLEVDAGESGQETRTQCGRKANQSILFGTRGHRHCRRLRAGIGELHEDDAQHQQHQRSPLRANQLLSQNTDGENGRRQDLQLVRHLIGGRVQVRCGQVEQIVLHNVDERRNANLERVDRIGDHRGVQCVDEAIRVLALLVEDEHQTGAQFDQFGHDDGRRAEEHVAGTRSAVAHAEPEYGILEGECDETDVFEGVRVHCGVGGGETKVYFNHIFLKYSR